MKGREGKGPPSADLLVCFPSRSHLTLMPKPICSPARPPEPNKRQHHPGHRHHPHHHHHHHHHLKKFTNRNKTAAGQASPILWAKTKPYSKEIDEPTSPKVTCAGQIKVKPKAASSCKNWQSVMEEIERLHNHRKHKKRPTWVEALGFKKDVMQFLTCLRNLRFDFRCFGTFPSSSITSDDEDDGDEEDDVEYHQDRQNNVSKESRDVDDHDSETSRTVFSKWFMVLQENNSTNKELIKDDINKMIRDKFSHEHEEEAVDDEAPCAPPPNALLLMRCRSAPAKSWLEEKEEEDDEEIHDDDDDDDNEDEQEDENEGIEKQKREEELAMEEEKKRKDNLVVMRCGTDFYKFSSDIAKETWVVGGIREALSRSRSWKR